MPMPCFFHSNQLQFQPKYEWALGVRIKHPETTRRAQTIFQALKKDVEHFEMIEPSAIPMKVILELHNEQLVSLYHTACELKDDNTFYPSVFPQRAKAHPDPKNIHHSGFYCFDSGTPINNKTWLAAVWSAAAAYRAAQHLIKGHSRVAYSLSRPPGHHASKDAYGGYCYFNNAAIAARQFRKKGKVAIIDIDFHHGNGTQELFYSDDKVLVISLHGDPAKFFPYFSGYPNEIGKGKGEGFNRNIILPDECELKPYLTILHKEVLPAIEAFDPNYLVLSAGFDTYINDPIGNSKLVTQDYKEIAKVFSALGLPTLVCQEGGYYTQDLGLNVKSFLYGFDPL